MVFPYNIEVNRCIGSCSNINNPYFRMCFPDIVKNISVKMFNLKTQQNETRLVTFHESCKCDCLLNSTVCNDKQKWNESKCRCECLKVEKCDDDFLWNISNCECEYSKAAKLTTTKECEEINDDDISNKKTILIK